MGPSWNRRIVTAAASRYAVTRVRSFSIVCLLAAHASAEPWYRGEHGANRVVHLSLTAVGLGIYPLTAAVEPAFASTCRWCSGPNAVDASVRNALVWTSDHELAASTSDVTAYVLAPGVGISLVLAGTLQQPGWAAVIDDVVPVFETFMVTEYATKAIKVATARARPDVHFFGASDGDDYLSFPSGHTSGAFAFATSAGWIAHARDYRSEPYIWAGGLTLAVLSGYLRIAADRHYLTDVLGGATLGVAAGLTVPLLMRRRDVAVVVTSQSATVAGHW